jgi:hypothetical protein
MPQISMREFEQLPLPVHDFSRRAFRFMMCGLSICRTLGQGSRSMSFRGRQGEVRTCSKIHQ